MALPAQEIISSSCKFVETKEQFQRISSVSTNAYRYLETCKDVANVTRLIFFRHGESTSNAEKSIAGRTLQVSITAQGVNQAAAAGKKLQGTKIRVDAVYSSPSIRAIETAKLIYSGANPITDERLYEKFYGPYEAASEKEYRPVKQIEEEENSGPDKSFEQKITFKAHPEMESMQEVYNRTENFILNIHRSHNGKNVVVATHNGVLKALFMKAEARNGYEVDYRSFTVGNASALVLEVDGSGIRVVATNGLSFRK